MAAETLNCPMCGAAASSDSTKCDHCGARLATVACPSCFGMIFLGAKFCSHCGAKVQRAEITDDKQELCPGCKTPMEAVELGQTKLKECPKCEGIWATNDALQQICSDRERQAAILGTPMKLDGEPVAIEQIRYRPCPDCHNMMNRVNFAHCSGVIVDVCTLHGTWFDKDELRRIVEFIRAGGLVRAREREIRELEEKQRELRSGLISPSGLGESGIPWDQSDDRHTAISLVGSLLRGFLDF